ncbi:MAG: tRNA (adenosine(37)-N6)-dimethylallyltransferase MiaA [Deltaproteobacteria bacterium]|jgi:tRNA dimethylallyltransferase|nr:tRNA (adenosine(37)-N6)-dimethylallyltransferase MiaA [Deltaproteobacteria bacterium]
MSDERPRVIAVMGPTAVGKTWLTSQLTKNLGGEIVNADSVQIYRFMDIGTAKPTMADRAEVVHHLVDIVDPDQDFDASRYSQLAREVIARLARQGKPALVVGGTGLYLKAIFHGLFPGAPSDPIVRQRLRREAAKKGRGELYQRLQRLDPVTAQRVHPHDLFRIIRALEVWECRGQPISVLQSDHDFSDRPFLPLKIGLRRPRPELYERINSRVEKMMSLGLLEEVRELLSRGYGPHLKSMQALGYRHMVQHLIHGVAITEAVRTMKRDTRRYAKRQMTWFRRDQEINWFHPSQKEDIVRLAGRFLCGLNRDAS